MVEYLITRIFDQHQNCSVQSRTTTTTTFNYDVIRGSKTYAIMKKHARKLEYCREKY